MSVVRPTLEYGAACWDPYRGQITALDRVQKKAAKFAHHMNSSNWETLASRRKLSRMCSLKIVLRRMGVEGYRLKIKTATLSEQGRSYS